MGAKKKESVTNRAALKRFILEQAKAVRPGWECKRVSAQALDEIEAFVRTKVRDSLRRQPTVGKTYKQFY